MESKDMKKKKKVLPPEEISVFCSQMTLIIRSGLLLSDGMEALVGDYKNTPYADAFAQMDDVLRQTGSLSAAIDASEIFPDYVEGMVRVGEQAGEIETVMQGLADYYERESKIRRTIRNAVFYPMMLMTIMAVVIVILIVRIMPVFEKVFNNMGSDLPAMTRTMMAFSGSAGRWVLAIVVVLIAAVLLCYRMFKSGTNERFVQWVLRAVAPIGRISHSMSAERFASIMSMLLSGGFPIERAIELLPDVFSNQQDRERMKACQDQIMKGDSIPDAVEKLGLFEPLHMRMIRVGFMSGQMDNVMGKMAQIYEENTDDGISRIVSMIEPIMVAVLSVIIGVILLSVMLPLASLMSSMV
ncbi:MAG: type II secretion system F family protein [Clostridia bacterium]|nr:type II secretion system F family protein [Clostridia bacterium]